MNRRPLAPAPTSVQNVAQATLRSHSRAAHGGSGTYTEMRAQIRKEREQQRHVGAGAGLSNTHTGRDVDQHARKSSSASANTSVQLSASISDQKISQFSSDPTTDDQAAEKKPYLRVLAPSSFAMSSDNISNMSNASSQISSSSSQGVVRKRSQTLSTQQQQQQLQQPQQPAQTQTHLLSHQPQSQMQQLQHQLQHQLQLQHQQPSRHDTRYTFQEDLLPRTSSPLLEEEQQIGIDALQDAFQAKYYELAAKCKGWEKYSAKLKAHLGALEAENRLIKEQNSQLEAENAELRAVVLQEAKTRTKLEGRMNTLEDCLSQRSLSGGNLNAQYRAVDVVDYDHLSVPSAPSSAERNTEGAPAPRHTPYCSSNLQFEDRSELRPSASNHANAFSMVQTVTTTQHMEPELGAQIAASNRDFSLDAARSSMDTTRSMAGSQSPMPEHIPGTSAFDGPTRGAAEGRSSRLGTRSDMPEKRPAHQRSGTVGALGMVVPRAGTVLGDYRGSHALTSQALAHQDAAESIARPASAQRFHGTYLESNIATTAASIVTSTGVTKAALQSKRRSTVSGDRASSLSLAQIVKGALTASGVVARSSSTTLSRQSSPNDKPQSSSDYLQECVEKRREAMRSSFNAQQKTMTPIGSQTVPSRPASRAASRLSTQSGTRTRSRAGSVHDAIPVAVEDIFCNQKTVKAHSNETSPEFLTEQLAAAGLNVHADITAASQRLMAATEAQPVRLMARKELSNASSPSSLVSASPALEAEEGISFERKLYMRFQQELNGEEFQKFERCIQRYDFLDIPLEGSKGLITRVKRLLLVSDPDLRSKPDKLKVRQQLARDFEKMAKNFSQAQSTQP